MKHYLKYYVLLLYTIFAVPAQANHGYWQCITTDSANNQWIVKSAYKRSALNIAFDSCKKESKTPTTCKSSANNCEGFNNGFSNNPMWKCTAIDSAGAAWKSNSYTQRDDAALAAKAYCTQNSSLPYTCYIDLVTCVNSSEGAKM